jgi:hypothetical protein
MLYKFSLPDCLSDKNNLNLISHEAGKLYLQNGIDF